MYELSLYNTASRQLEKFRPINPATVKMYACGPTVYNYSHIGNMRTYVFEDVLRRTLESLSYDVKHVMNITDVGHLQSDADEGEDKMSLASKKEQKSPWDIAKYYEQAFFKHAQMLNILTPKTIARATEHIPEMIAMVITLIDRGFAYENEGNVYFDVAKFKQYPDFAKLQMNAHEATNRVEHDNKKRNQADFALWFSHSKFKNQIMKWSSPWGEGFPGWHIECSAMAMKYLGDRIDIHCGGIDHIPVHHTNEIAQSECCTGHQWVSYWLHGAFLTEDDGKMSKSSGKFLTIDSIAESGFHPLSYRYLILGTHYRSELKFSYDSLASAEEAYKNLFQKAQSWQEEGAATDQETELSRRYTDQFYQSLCNDLHTPSALAVAWSVAKDDALNSGEKFKLISMFDQVLGLKLSDPLQPVTPKEKDLIEQRQKARSEKNWQRSDDIRDELLDKHNLQIKDTSTNAKVVRVLPLA